MAGQVGDLPATGTTATSGATYGSTDPNYPYPPSTGSTAAAGALGGYLGSIPTATPIVDPESVTSAVAGSGSGQPTVSQLMPTSFGVYTSVNPTAEAAAALRTNNPLGAGSRDLANVLDAIHAMFKAGS
jgi:hypothetical protein